MRFHCGATSHKSRALRSHPQPGLSTFILCYAARSEREPTSTSCSSLAVYCSSSADEDKDLNTAVSGERIAAIRELCNLHD